MIRQFLKVISHYPIECYSFRIDTYVMCVHHRLFTVIVYCIEYLYVRLNDTFYKYGAMRVLADGVVHNNVCVHRSNIAALR